MATREKEAAAPKRNGRHDKSRTFSKARRPKIKTVRTHYLYV